jgi:hypothetical protein
MKYIKEFFFFGTNLSVGDTVKCIKNSHFDAKELYDVFRSGQEYKISSLTKTSVKVDGDYGKTEIFSLQKPDQNTRNSSGYSHPRNYFGYFYDYFEKV